MKISSLIKKAAIRINLNATRMAPRPVASATKPTLKRVGLGVAGAGALTLGVGHHIDKKTSSY